MSNRIPSALAAIAAFVFVAAAAAAVVTEATSSDQIQAQLLEFRSNIGKAKEELDASDLQKLFEFTQMAKAKFSPQELPFGADEFYSQLRFNQLFASKGLDQDAEATEVCFKFLNSTKLLFTGHWLDLERSSEVGEQDKQWIYTMLFCTATIYA